MAGGVGLVVHHRQLHALVVEQGIALGREGVETLDELQGIGVGLLGDGQQHGREALVADQMRTAFVAAARRGDFPQRHPARRRDDGGLGQARGIGGLALHAHQPLGVQRGHAARQYVAEPARHGIGHLDGGQAGRRHLRGIEVHVQFGFVEPQGQHLVHTFQLFQVLLEHGGGPAQMLAARAVDGDIGGREAVGGGDFEDLRIGRFQGQFRRVLVLHLAAQVVDALVEHPLGQFLETHQDRGQALARRRGHELDVLHLAMASSRGPVISSSMSSAEAPGRVVTMLTQLKLISGSWARGMAT
jgi:hypothetical protein